jgi:hypothetical protein
MRNWSRVWPDGAGTDGNPPPQAGNREHAAREVLASLPAGTTRRDQRRWNHKG